MQYETVEMMTYGHSGEIYVNVIEDNRVKTWDDELCPVL